MHHGGVSDAPAPSVPPASSLRGQVWHLGPHGGAHRVALRAAVSLAVPLLVVWATDHLAWSIYAAFGAFTALYGRDRVQASRLRLQATLAAFFVACVVAGTAVGLSEHRIWWSVPAATIVAGVGSYLSDAQQWHPPGPLFGVFAVAACASIPSTPSDLWPALLVSGATAAFSVAVGSVGAWWRTAGRRTAGWRVAGRLGTTPPTERARSRWTERAERTERAVVARRHVVRCAAGCLLAGTVATALSTPLGIGHPYWAMVAAVVPLAARDWHQQVTRGLQRLIGTLGGLLVAAGLLAVDLPVLACWWSSSPCRAPRSS